MCAESACRHLRGRCSTPGSTYQSTATPISIDSSPQVYDYLNFFPFYAAMRVAARRHAGRGGAGPVRRTPAARPDSPAGTYESMQLFQRGVRWNTLKDSLKNRFVRPARELINEWATDLEMAPGIDREEEKELIADLANPNIPISRLLSRRLRSHRASDQRRRQPVGGDRTSGCARWAGSGAQFRRVPGLGNSARARLGPWHEFDSCHLQPGIQSGETLQQRRQAVATMWSPCVIR